MDWKRWEVSRSESSTVVMRLRTKSQMTRMLTTSSQCHAGHLIMAKLRRIAIFNGLASETLSSGTKHIAVTHEKI